MPESQEKLTQSYFDYLAKSFPVMCASDEFHFLPRSEAASRYYDRMEILDPGFIEECIFTLREFQRNFDLLAAGEDDLGKTYRPGIAEFKHSRHPDRTGGKPFVAAQPPAIFENSFHRVGSCPQQTGRQS